MVFFPGGHTESKKRSEEAGDDMDDFDADEEDDEEVDSDKEMGLDDEDGDEASSSQLQKLAAEVCRPPPVFAFLDCLMPLHHALPCFSKICNPLLRLFDILFMQVHHALPCFSKICNLLLDFLMFFLCRLEASSQLTRMMTQMMTTVMMRS
jgi:hypothetical protein